MNRRGVSGILILALLLSATPWEAVEAASQSEDQSCCVCLCLFTSSLLLPAASVFLGAAALLPAPSGPLSPVERSFADPPLRLVFHPPRRA